MMRAETTNCTVRVEILPEMSTLTIDMPNGQSVQLTAGVGQLLARGFIDIVAANLPKPPWGGPELIDPSRISLAAFNALKRGGFETAQSVREATDERLLAIQSLGVGKLADIRRAYPHTPRQRPMHGYDPDDLADLLPKDGDAKAREALGSPTIPLDRARAEASNLLDGSDA